MTALEPVTPDRTAFRYSLVIPVYNSEGVVGATSAAVLDSFRGAGLNFELILVNDGSKDRSWQVIADLARAEPEITAINLLRNYGQHNANLAGLRASTGDYIITLDDDLQNPPDQALRLIDKALEGDHDVVFGQFDSKQAAGYRRIGTKLIAMINSRVFEKPPDLVVSNFRILRRDVVDRISESTTTYPYLTGQALMYSHSCANETVRHEPRTIGTSNYSLVRILRLVATILFSYSVFPLRVAALGGFAISVLSFLIGAYYLLHAAFGASRVQGWTTTVVLLAMFNGVVIMLLSMLGEYVVRTLNLVSHAATYHVRETIQ